MKTAVRVLNGGVEQGDPAVPCEGRAVVQDLRSRRERQHHEGRTVEYYGRYLRRVLEADPRRVRHQQGWHDLTGRVHRTTPHQES